MVDTCANCPHLSAPELGIEALGLHDGTMTEPVDEADSASARGDTHVSQGRAEACRRGAELAAPVV